MAKTKESEIIEYLTRKAGFNLAVACGIAANLKNESSYELLANGDNGTSFGLAQWHKSRKDKLIVWCDANGLAADSLEGQLGYLVYELTKTSYYKRLVGKYVDTTENSENGAYDFAYTFCHYYEAPAHWESSAISRGNLASDLFRNYFTEEEKEGEKPLAVGDKVFFRGTVHFRSANAKIGRFCIGGEAKITRIYRLGKSKHPYHIKSTRLPCNVCGWVDESKIERLK